MSCNKSSLCQLQILVFVSIKNCYDDVEELKFLFIWILLRLNRNKNVVNKRVELNGIEKLNRWGKSSLRIKISEISIYLYAHITFHNWIKSCNERRKMNSYPSIHPISPNTCMSMCCVVITTIAAHARALEDLLRKIVK